MTRRRASRRRKWSQGRGTDDRHGDGSRIELEGNRIPLTHSKGVIYALQE
jgi:hypothetical protein